MTEIMTGGCQCGRVRYRAEVETDEAYLCHCRMCQRATGGVSIAFANMPQAALTWETEPDWYGSSPIARRPFCSRCGTPLGFRFVEGDTIDIAVGSFDDPGHFRPHHHFGVESLHEAWLDTGALPRERADAYQPLTDRWVAAIGKTPE
ncbi:MAG TPA: GFA family protein [Sphingobium sp.]|uniref:GFA family protein n=1 Tax=Sphingobium sp. TaxID=1912891 RepID=UPI002ED655EF